MFKIKERIVPKSKTEKKIIGIMLVIFIFFCALDLITKFIVVKNMDLNSHIVIINNFFNLVHVQNKGAAFSILWGKGSLLLMIALTVSILILIFLRSITEGYKERYYAIALVMSGIIGNSIDRIFRKGVVDFLDFYLSFNGEKHHWPAFNVADITICVGVGILMLSFILRAGKEKTKSDNQTEN